MKNLAGVQDCDVYIAGELALAGIKVVKGEKSTGEVPSSMTGKLGRFEFVRAWYYYRVAGEVPLEVAEELYNCVLGKRDIRVVGHCGCPPPRGWACPRSEDIFEFGLENKSFGEIRDLCECGGLNVPLFINSYHIDSQEGLNLFVEVIKRHGLV
jgi:hypothetical protein